MNLTRRQALAAALVATAARPARAVAAVPTDLQPHASYWYPDTLPPGTPPPGVRRSSLRTWSAAGDPDLPFNRATVPLAPRLAPPPPNPTARRDEARISALAAFAPTSGNPSQGSATADYYALTHWAYLDELVFWGGSSDEGLILAPNAPVVDAAHRNGVPVLGTVFLPPTAYGGRLEWTRDLVRRGADGGFPIADKLIEVARAYGFDGWFLNAETGGGDARLGADMRDFVAYLRERGGPALRVTWYDAMAVSGDIAWQNELNDRNSPFFRAAGTMFLNFNWSRTGLASSGELARSLGRSPYELWAGIDVEANGWDTRVDWDAIAPAGRPHLTSFGFYRPEWTWKSLPGSDRCPAAFHARDDRFWSGASLDPVRPDPGPWRAPAASVADRSTLTSLPFATTFNTGHGLGWYERGVRLADTPWNHLGLQDRLPGRRWVIRTAGARPAVGFDFTDAWRGGSSLLIDAATGATAATAEPTTVELYASRLPLSPTTVAELAHRTDPGSAAVRVELAVALDEPDRFTYLPVGTLPAGGSGWTTATLRLASLLHGRAAATAHVLGIRLTAPDGGDVRWRLGELALHDGPPVPPGPPDAPAVTASARNPDGTAALRLTWRQTRRPPHRDPAPVRHYELHQVVPGGRRRFLGGTCGHAYYVPALRRTADEEATRVEVRAVDELYTASAPASVTHRW
ncbi:endo-beta-N-acetylglucosaminidase [Streptomyces sp. NPDC001678]|uniref:endo-beta-N-acetylglucosaminidase n=1 Tax=Streptomyces sp. NPDC001678 TaxID=3364599 RepID=UPI0036939B24